ncbi:MAG: DUF4935 domain-containing protein [Gammaproteobacteria bacterium]|nr:DUF4935 domain-containing protein [Gammaproteobacteria bacterium]
MLHIVLDSSIYRRDQNFKTSEFKVIKILSNEERIQIHLPYIVEHEFKSQVLKHSSDKVQTIKNNLSSLYGHNKNNNFEWHKKLSFIQNLNENDIDSIAKESINYIDEWFLETKTHKHDIEKDDISLVFNNYFKGMKPFKDKKSREDIPDAFIFKTILNLHELYADNLIAIINDKDLRTACEEQGIIVYDSLNNFTRSSHFTELNNNRCIEQHKIDIIQKISDALTSNNLEDLTSDIVEYFTENDLLPIISQDLDIGEINSFRVTEIDDISEIAHIGTGIFTTYFSFRFEVETLTPIFVEETNKQYYTKNKETISASGKIIIETDATILSTDCTNIKDFINSAKIEINDISGFEPSSKILTQEDIAEPSSKNSTRVGYYVLNTNTKNSSTDQQRMINEKVAAAFYEPWKYYIKSLKQGDVVFLYQSGVGIIACGIASGDLKIRDYDGDEGEEYYMSLNYFHLLKSPISASEMKYISGRNFNFMRTMFAIDTASGETLHEVCIL